MTHLALLIHADPSVGPAYVAALAKACPEPVAFRIVNSPHKGLSSAYRALAAMLRQRHPGKPLLEALLAYAGVGPRASYQTVTLASFSAGYALVQEVLAEPVSAELVDGVVGIDSWHTGLEADGTANDVQLAGLVRHALRAREAGAALASSRVCFIGHTDVRTPQKPGPWGAPFASTTQVATEIRRLCALPTPDADGFAELGALRVMARNDKTSDTSEHVNALTGWGPAWLAVAVATLAAMRGAADTERPPASAPATCAPVGALALQIARQQQRLGVREVAGAAAHPQILAYLAGCERGGRVIGGSLRSDEIAWCAAGASWCTYQAAPAGAKLPHRWRAAVRELWEDAIAAGVAVGASRLRKGLYTPLPGDLVILTRGGPARGEGASAFAATAGLGHVGRLVTWHLDGRMPTLDGNVGNTWTDVERHVSAPELVGVVPYEAFECTVGEDEIAGLDALDGAAALARAA